MHLFLFLLPVVAVRIDLFDDSIVEETFTSMETETAGSVN